MTQQKTLKQKIWKSLKSFYWRHISSIDDFWKYHMTGQKPMYRPSFFKIHTPEEAEKIMEENHKFFEAKLEELGKWEEAWKAEEAQKSNND